MKKNNSIFVILMVALAMVVVGLIIYSVGKKKTATSALDLHGHPTAANISAAPFNPDNLVNEPAPDSVLTDKNGKTYSLDELRGKNIILFFNEGLMCYPACWNQIAALAQDQRFKNSETVVLSVVVDPRKDWQKAIDQMPELAEATMAFDEGGIVSKEFGVLTTPSSMHYGSLPGHTYALIDKEGIIRHIFDDPNMAIHNDQLAIELAKLN